ncbi:hypothetical protein [Pseudemcibacter aquimaris]|uniref:hypothetical protein n=1 Tax=Pseudemcibacter aquimaris TaxID=2857064 RepID=UPI002010E1CE|nr:hypothetical protein [Pseudemcibacter aquimaris]MCC3860805.1 hypothetical protein [Pseudemcibacter aquimaris]WDU59625.1 hypothetical protein KW060_05040 [Pseudemcibacter aquimaris]
MTQEQLTHEHNPVSTLIEITKQLTSVLNEEMECLKSKRPSEIKDLQERKNILTASYYKEMNTIKSNGGLASAGNGEIVRTLKKVSRFFQETLERHTRYIKAKKELTENMIKEISEEISKKNGTNTKYGRNAKMANNSVASRTTTMAINQTV